MKNKTFISLAGFFGFVAFFIVDPIATYWRAWEFDHSQTSSIYFGHSNLDTLIWAILVCVIVATAVAAGAEREEASKFFFKKKHK